MAILAAEVHAVALEHHDCDSLLRSDLHLANRIHGGPDHYAASSRPGRGTLPLWFDRRVNAIAEPEMRQA